MAKVIKWLKHIYQKFFKHHCQNCGRIMCAKNAQKINDGIVGLTATLPDAFCSYGKRKQKNDFKE